MRVKTTWDQAEIRTLAPTMYASGEFVQVGSLLSYCVDLADSARRSVVPYQTSRQPASPGTASSRLGGNVN